jgi:hypothetical protein
MANNTNPGLAPSGGNHAAWGDVGAGADAETQHAPPFGDPDQQLYGGSGGHSMLSHRSAPADDAAYQGRHRAAD